MSNYEIRRYDTAGNPLKSLTGFKKLTYIRTENTVGGLELILPMKKYQPGDFANNQLLEIWRTKHGATELMGETAYFTKDPIFSSKGGEKLIKILALDANWLLTTRIVAYAAASAQAKMTDYADDMMKAIVTDALGGDAIAARQLSDLTIAGDLSDAGSLSKAFSRRNVYDVCRELAEAATAAGTYTYFDVVRTAVAKFAFRTYTGQRGQDHGASSEDVRLVGEQYENFDDIEFGTYHSGEVNYVYAGGQGEEADREIVEVSDADRIADGYPFNRCEGFVDARNCDTTALVTAEGNAGLDAGKPRQVLTGRIVDTPGMQYNIHYGFGDIVSAEAFGFKVDCHIKTTKIVVEDGEDITVRLWGEL